MPLLSWLRAFGLLLLPGLLGASAAGAPLVLICEFNGHAQPVTGVERGRAFCLIDGKKTEVPNDAVWRLDGDLPTAAHAIDWSPAYQISRFDTPDWERAKQSQPMRAGINVNHATKTGTKPAKSAFLRRWPSGTVEPALAVFAWVKEGAAIAVAARPVPVSARVEFFSAHHEFKLTAAEAGGHPAVLIWQKGAFLPVAPRFTDPAAQAALTALGLDDDAKFTAALAAGLKPASADPDGITLLHYAAEMGRLGAVEALLATKVKPDVNSGKVATPLQWAVRTGRLATVDRLIAAGADVDERANGHTPLIEAIGLRHDDIALHLAAKADVSRGDTMNRAPISHAIDMGLADVARVLLTRRARYDFAHEQVTRVLLTQADRGHTAVVQLLLEKKVKPNVDFRGNTPLVAAARVGDPALARVLIAAGAAPDQASSRGLTPLMMAALQNRAEFASTLLDAGARVDAARADGTAALHFAAQGRAVETVDLLLARGAKPDAANARQATPLQIALTMRAPRAVASLAARGAKLNVRAPDFADQLEMALALDAGPLIRAALADGASPGIKLYGRWPILRVAEICNATACAELLRAAGAGSDPDATLEVGRPNELDSRLRLARAMTPIDPRDIDEIYPTVTVELDVLVDTGGEVRFPRIVGTPEAWLASATLAAVSQWQFAPPLRQGKPAAVQVRVPVEFASSSDRARDISEVDVLPVVVRQVAPAYPEGLRAESYGGEVRIRFVVNTQGGTENVKVVFTAHPDLDAAVVSAVEKWTFKPGQLEGKPVPTRMEIPVLFSTY